jgi:hypothetical protein
VSDAGLAILAGAGWLLFGWAVWRNRRLMLRLARCQQRWAQAPVVCSVPGCDAAPDNGDVHLRAYEEATTARLGHRYSPARLVPEEPELLQAGYRERVSSWR